jgi:succinate dehydrogenase / fumarate reductase flavoprotein subunit
VAIRERAAKVAAPGGAAANPAWQSWLDLRSLVVVAEAVVRSALERRESRGAHVRDDYPEADSMLSGANVVIRGSAGALQATCVPRAEPPEALQRLAPEGVDA